MWYLVYITCNFYSWILIFKFYSILIFSPKAKQLILKHIYVDGITEKTVYSFHTSESLRDKDKTIDRYKYTRMHGVSNDILVFSSIKKRTKHTAASLGARSVLKTCNVNLLSVWAKLWKWRELQYFHFDVEYPHLY